MSSEKTSFLLEVFQNKRTGMLIISCIATMSSKIISWNTQQTLSQSASRPNCIRKIQDRHITTDIHNIPDNKCTLLFAREARKQQSKGNLVKKSRQVRILLKIESQSKAPKQTLYEMVAEEPSLFWFLMQSSNPVEFWQIQSACMSWVYGARFW